MKKNGQYVGVDEKYVPEDEKYVENNSNTAKGFRIGYLAFGVILTVMMIVVFVLVLSQFFKINEIKDKIINSSNQDINNIYDKYNKMTVDDFNFDIETYSGIQDGSAVLSLLDNVITNIKKSTNHPITVIYDTTTTSKVNEITTLKKQFDISIQYEVSLAYDSNGYINIVTITNY